MALIKTRIEGKNQILDVFNNKSYSNYESYTIENELDLNESYHIIKEPSGEFIAGLSDYLSKSKVIPLSSNEILINTNIEITTGDTIILNSYQSQHCYLELQTFLTDNIAQPYWLKRWLTNKGWTNIHSNCLEFEPYSFLYITEIILFRNPEIGQIINLINDHLSKFTKLSLLSNKLQDLKSILINTDNSVEKFQVIYDSSPRSMPYYQTYLVNNYDNLTIQSITNSNLDAAILIMFAHNLGSGNIGNIDTSTDIRKIPIKDAKFIAFFSCEITDDEIAKKVFCKAVKNKKIIIAPKSEISEAAVMFYLHGVLETQKRNWPISAVHVYAMISLFNYTTYYDDKILLFDSNNDCVSSKNN